MDQDTQLTLPSIPNATATHGIISGGQPDEKALRDAAAAGVRTIVNLQLETEEGVASERTLAETLGLRYVSIPVAGAAGINSETAAALDRVLAEAESPVIVHCAGGNRVGALMALRAFNHQGLSAADALEVGKATGLKPNLEGAVKAQMSG